MTIQMLHGIHWNFFSRSFSVLTILCSRVPPTKMKKKGNTEVEWRQRKKKVREEKLLLWIAKKSHENHRDGTTAQPSWTTRRAWAWGENFSSPERRASTSTACCVNNGTGEEGMERSEVEAKMALACLLLRLLCALAYRALLKSSFNFRTWLSWRVVVAAFFFLFSSLAACVYILYHPSPLRCCCCAASRLRSVCRCITVVVLRLLRAGLLQIFHANVWWISKNLLNIMHCDVNSFNFTPSYSLTARARNFFSLFVSHLLFSLLSHYLQCCELAECSNEYSDSFGRPFIRHLAHNNFLWITNLNENYMCIIRTLISADMWDGGALWWTAHGYVCTPNTVM